MIRTRGFTLIELMIVVAVVAILAAVAYPSYVDSVRKSRRAQAISALEDVRLAQAKWRANQTTYFDEETVGHPELPVPGHYEIAIEAADGVGFVATATAIDAQAGDTECAVFTITQAGPHPDDSEKCWKR